MKSYPSHELPRTSWTATRSSILERGDHRTRKGTRSSDVFLGVTSHRRSARLAVFFVGIVASGVILKDLAPQLESFGAVVIRARREPECIEARQQEEMSSASGGASVAGPGVGVDTSTAAGDHGKAGHASERGYQCARSKVDKPSIPGSQGFAVGPGAQGEADAQKPEASLDRGKASLDSAGTRALETTVQLLVRPTVVQPCSSSFPTR